MSSTPITDLTKDWDASKKFAVSEETDIVVTNPGVYTVRWEVTDSDTLPELAVTQAHFLHPGESRGMTLLAGDRFWPACPEGVLHKQPGSVTIGG